MDHDLQDPIVMQARRRVALKTGWYVHASIFTLVNLGLWALNQYTSGTRWHYYPLLGWGLGLAVHGAVVLMRLQGAGQRSRMLSAEVKALRRRHGAPP